MAKNGHFWPFFANFRYLQRANFLKTHQCGYFNIVQHKISNCCNKQGILQLKQPKMGKNGHFGPFSGSFFKIQATWAGLVFFTFQSDVINNIFEDQLSSGCITIEIKQQKRPKTAVLGVKSCAILPRSANQPNKHNQYHFRVSGDPPKKFQQVCIFFFFL